MFHHFHPFKTMHACLGFQVVHVSLWGAHHLDLGELFRALKSSLKETVKKWAPSTKPVISRGPSLHL